VGVDVEAPPFLLAVPTDTGAEGRGGGRQGPRGDDRMSGPKASGERPGWAPSTFPAAGPTGLTVPGLRSPERRAHGDDRAGGPVVTAGPAPPRPPGHHGAAGGHPGDPAAAGEHRPLGDLPPVRRGHPVRQFPRRPPVPGIPGLHGGMAEALLGVRQGRRAGLREHPAGQEQGRAPEPLRGRGGPGAEGGLAVFLHRGLERAEHLAPDRLGVLAQRLGPPP